MTHKEYLKRYNQWVKRFVARGVVYIRKVFWCLTRYHRHYYNAQLNAMRLAYKGLS